MNRIIDEVQNERERVIAAYWQDKGGLEYATEGAREISALHDIPVNSVRGLQNKMFPDFKPWKQRIDAVKTCKKCTREAYDDQGIEAFFGFRNMKRVGGVVRKPQSYCRACRSSKKQG